MWNCTHKLQKRKYEHKKHTQSLMASNVLSIGELAVLSSRLPVLIHFYGPPFCLRLSG